MLIIQTLEQTSHSSKLQARTELQSITLLSCTATRGSSLQNLIEPLNLSITQRGTGECCGGGFSASVSFSVRSVDSGQPQKDVFQIYCVFKADYLVRDTPPTEEELAAFSSANALFNCWPYARELVQSLTSRMDLRVPALPYLRIQTNIPPVLLEAVKNSEDADELQKGKPIVPRKTKGKRKVA